MNPYDFIRQFRATDQFGRTPIVAIMARFGNEAGAFAYQQGFSATSCRNSD